VESVWAGTWISAAEAGHRREAWAGEFHFTLAMPLMGLTAAAVSLFAPSRVWRWAMLPFAAQALVAFLQDPTANLLPLGLIMFGLFGLICMTPAALGAAIGRRVAR
jgi:hypothetical protein